MGPRRKELKKQRGTQKRGRSGRAAEVKKPAARREMEVKLKGACRAKRKRTSNRGGKRSAEALQRTH